MLGAATLVVTDAVVWSGVLVGLALLARSVAAVGVMSLFFASGALHGLRATGRLVLVAIATVALGLLPFAVADGRSLVHSLVSYRGSEPIGGGSVWALLHNAPLGLTIQRIDIALVVVLGATLSAVVVWRRSGVLSTSAGLCGLLAIASACFPLLAKTVYPYYLMEPYVFATVWWLARPGSAWNWRVLVPMLLTVDAIVLKLTSDRPLEGVVLVAGVTSTCILAGVIALILRDLVGQPAARNRRSRVAAETVA